MISAAEARALENGDRLKSVINEVELKIKQAISRRERECVYCMYKTQDMTDAVSEYLEKLGYEVYWNDCILGLEISWK